MTMAGSLPHHDLNYVCTVASWIRILRRFSLFVLNLMQHSPELLTELVQAVLESFLDVGWLHTVVEGVVEVLHLCTDLVCPGHGCLLLQQGDKSSLHLVELLLPAAWR